MYHMIVMSGFPYSKSDWSIMVVGSGQWTILPHKFQISSSFWKNVESTLYMYTGKEPILPLFLSNILSLTEWKHFEYTENVAALNWHCYDIMMQI